MRIFVYDAHSCYELVFECFNHSLCIIALWLPGETYWYLIFIVFVVGFKAVDALLFMKSKPGFITWIFKSSVNYVKDFIISSSLPLFIDLVRMELNSYTYIT